jgi:hypothetical protein
MALATKKSVRYFAIAELFFGIQYLRKSISSRCHRQLHFEFGQLSKLFGGFGFELGTECRLNFYLWLGEVAI